MLFAGVTMKYGLLAILLTVVIAVEVAVIVMYVILCAENYNWWWTSFMSMGSVGIYFLVFSLYYLHVLLPGESVATMLYTACYLLIFAIVVMVMMGAVGFVAAFFFIDILFGRSKLD